MPPQELDQLQNAPSPVVMAIVGIVGLRFLLLMIVGGWKIFTKAGELGLRFSSRSTI